MQVHAGIDRRTSRTTRFPLEDNWYHARQRAARGEGSRELMLDVLGKLRESGTRNRCDGWAEVDIRQVRGKYPGMHTLIFSGILASLRAAGVYRSGRVELETELAD